MCKLYDIKKIYLQQERHIISSMQKYYLNRKTAWEWYNKVNNMIDYEAKCGRERSPKSMVWMGEGFEVLKRVDMYLNCLK